MVVAPMILASRGWSHKLTLLLEGLREGLTNVSSSGKIWSRWNWFPTLTLSSDFSSFLAEKSNKEGPAGQRQTHRRHTHTLILTHTQSYSHTLILTLTLTQPYSHTLTYTITHSHTHAHTLSHTQSHTLIYTHTVTYSHTLTLNHAHTHLHTCSHSHMHTSVASVLFIDWSCLFWDRVLLCCPSCPQIILPHSGK